MPLRDEFGLPLMFVLGLYGMPEFRFSAPADRNKQAILDALRSFFIGPQRVLEIGSGTGQHAVFFTRRNCQS